MAIASGLALAGSSFAVPFDTTTVDGTATVGSGGDYPSLASAASAFNALGSPYLQGNWKLSVLNNLVEPVNVAFGNTIPDGSSLTLGPATGTSATLTFTAIADNNGPSGNLVVGCYDLSGWNLLPTNHFIIDGSNGVTSQSLYITNTVAENHSYAVPIAVAGDSDHVTLRNLTVVNATTATASNTAGISAVSRGTGTTTPMLVPDDLTIQNCDIITTAASQGHGILFRISGTLPTSLPVASITGFEISNCRIQGRLRGIFSDIGMDGSITSNTIACGIGNTTGYLQLGVAINNARGNTNQTLNVSGNQLYMQSANTFAGDYGVIACSVASASATGNVVNFINNMVNFKYTSSASATSNSMTYQAFRATSGITYNILQNSINMPNFANLASIVPVGNATDSRGGDAIRLPIGATYTANIKNNIMRLDQAGVAGINMSMNSGTATVNSDNNVIFRSKANSYTGVSGTGAAPVNYLTLADWQSSTSQDTNSAVVDPTATTGSKWNPATDNADLHFVPATVKPVGMPNEPLLVDVPTDIDGEARAIAGTLPGADEVLPATGVDEWSLF